MICARIKPGKYLLLENRNGKCIKITADSQFKARRLLVRYLTREIANGRG